MNLYNTKLILSCPKQTPNSIWVPKMANQAMEAPVTPTAAIATVIVEKTDFLILYPQEKEKTIAFPTFQSQKTDLDLSSSQRFSKQYRTVVKTSTMIISLILLVPTLSQHKNISCRITQSKKKRRLSKHHGKLGVADHFIGPDNTFGNSPTNSDMVEINPICNLYSHVPHHSNHNQGSFTRSHEWNKIIADKKSVM